MIEGKKTTLNLHRTKNIIPSGMLRNVHSVEIRTRGRKCYKCGMPLQWIARYGMFYCQRCHLYQY